jgi:hypothetical protein
MLLCIMYVNILFGLADTGPLSTNRNWPALGASSLATLRRSLMPGTNLSTAEVTHVSIHGFWLLLGDEELLVPFSEFPWFRQATIEQLTTIEWPSPDHLNWPLLDVDLSVACIRHREEFPLVSAVSAYPALQPDTPEAARR